MHERLDKNIVMPLCIMGCDSLFEKGYLLVNNEGLVEINQNKTITKKVDSYVSKLKGNKCNHFNEKTSSYFYHRYSMNSK